MARGLSRRAFLGGVAVPLVLGVPETLNVRPEEDVASPGGRPVADHETSPVPPEAARFGVP